MPGINFNGTTSKLEHLTAPMMPSATRTLCVWAYADGQGESNNGTIFNTPEGGQTRFRHAAAASSLALVYDFDTTDGVWTFPATDLQWNAVAIAYDAGNVANDPTARVNFANVTVTRATAPVGTGSTGLTGYCVGNNTGQTVTWDGGLMHMLVYNRVLTAVEMDAALRYPGRLRNGLILWLRMSDATDVSDYSGNGYHGTATDLTSRQNLGPFCGRWEGLGGYGIRSASAAAASKVPVFMRSYRQRRVA